MIGTYNHADQQRILRCDPAHAIHHLTRPGGPRWERLKQGSRRLPHTDNWREVYDFLAEDEDREVTIHLVS